MKKILFICFLFFTLTIFSQNQLLPNDIQIKTAVLAAPEKFRDGAKVLGYNEQEELVTLREGTNDMICLADDPAKQGISVSCYGKVLEPFMSRGRELTAAGKHNEKRQIRKEEIDAGTLKMPSEPAILYVLTGDEEDYDHKTGEIQNSYLRYVLYKPYMTVKSTGLPDNPQAPGMPWLMEAGTHRSHIMITPKNE